MCGIFFSIGFENLPAAVIDSVAHRGPNGRGWNEFISPNGPVIMAHRRLAIVDLSLDGHQPMSSEDNRFWVTYNGEIYNYLEIRKELEKIGYCFKTKTDTEVLLKSYLHWDKDCLHKFNGIFAFMIWDNKEKKVFAARDRFGVKPLYYYKQGNKIAFASEIKQFMYLPNFTRSIHKEHFNFFIQNKYHPISNTTLFQDVYHIEPGNYITIQMTNFKESTWYKPHPKEISEKQYNEEFLKLFEDATRKRLIADVPIGVLLSGGLDSSAIVCMIAELLSLVPQYRNIQTFTSWASDPAVDEKKYSDAVIAKTGLSNHLAEIHNNSLQKDIEEIIYHQEEPFFSTSIQSEWNIYKTISNQTNLKVILDGQGSDELICGYLFMIPQILADYFKSGKYIRGLKEFILTLKNHPELPWKTLSIDVLLKIYPKFVSFIQKLRKKNYIIQNTEIFDNFLEYSLYLIRKSIGPQLRWQDRSSMAFSIESRQPFLDYRLVEFLLGLPLQQKFHNGTTKVIIRNSLKGILPEIVRKRRSKFGFPSPQKKLMQHLESSYFQEYYQIGYKLIKEFRLIEDIYSLNKDSVQDQFSIFSLGLWTQKFQINS